MKEALVNGHFALTIGGDCSILIANSIVLKETGNFGLFFLDGHTDFIWPDLSETHGAAGMDLVIVTGHGHSKLTDIKQLKPYISEENVWCIGNRDFDSKYVSAIGNSNLNYYVLHKLRSIGAENCVNHFMKSMTLGNLAGFWIHLDVDVLDDSLMPAVDSRQEGGLTYEELSSILQPLLQSKLCAGMDITILDPDLDIEGKYTNHFVQLIGVAIRDSLQKREKNTQKDENFTP